VELLVALTVCALLSGAIASVAPQARAAFDAAPEALDIQQRERTVVDVLTRVVRSAALLTAKRSDGTPGVVAAAVDLSEPVENGEGFHVLRVLAMVGQGRGVLVDQAGPSGSLRLLSTDCPSTGDVCGFSKGTIAAVVDVAGRFDVFTVASTNRAANSVSPASLLDGSFAAGSALYEVSADTYYLEEQPDGSSTLVRETAGGAVQPMVDDVVGFSARASSVGTVITGVSVIARLTTRSTNPRRQVPDRTRHLSITLRNPS